MSQELTVKDKNTALSPFDAEMAKYAVEASAVEQASSLPKFVAKAGSLFFQGDPVKGNKVNVIVVDSLFENVLYESDYDPKEYTPPVCYALAHDDASLKPHDRVEKPKHTSCKGCPFNEFGSSTKGDGKGKACKNTRRLLLISADDLTDAGIAKAATAYMSVPTTSLKAWAAFVKGCASVMKRPPFAITTEISVTPDPKTQVKVHFNHLNNLTPEQCAAVMRRREQEKESLLFTYSAATEKTESEAPKSNKKRKY
jgi:hypothetical protein